MFQLTSLCEPFAWRRFAAIGAATLALTLFWNSERALSEPDTNDDAAILQSGCLNALMLGNSEEGALSYVLTEAGGKVEVVEGHKGQLDADSKLPYDGYRILRTGIKGRDDWAPWKICLYFRRGFLIRKCVVASTDKSTDEEIYQREIKSGLQHPPSYPGLMEKVHWGTAKKPALPESTRRKDADGRTIQPGPVTKLRCGIAFDGLPRGLRPLESNVLVLLQNVGPLPLDEELQLWGFPVGPIVTAGFAKDKSGLQEGYSAYFGIYGSRVRDIQIGDKKSPFHVAAYRLEAGESTFVWLSVPDLKSYGFATARFAGLMSDDREGIRMWDSEAAVELKR